MRSQGVEEGSCSFRRAYIKFFSLFFLADVVLASTVIEYPRYILDYNYQSSKFTLQRIEQKIDAIEDADTNSNMNLS